MTSGDQGDWIYKETAVKKPIIPDSIDLLLNILVLEHTFDTLNFFSLISFTFSLIFFI